MVSVSEIIESIRLALGDLGLEEDFFFKLNDDSQFYLYLSKESNYHVIELSYPDLDYELPEHEAQVAFDYLAAYCFNLVNYADIDIVNTFCIFESVDEFEAYVGSEDLLIDTAYYIYIAELANNL